MVLGGDELSLALYDPLLQPQQLGELCPDHRQLLLEGSGVGLGKVDNIPGLS